MKMSDFLPKPFIPRDGRNDKPLHRNNISFDSFMK